jgi:hypothetical protein
MVWYTAEYSAVMFGMEAFYLILCIGIGLALGLGDNDEATARQCQIVNVILSEFFFAIAWYFFTNVPTQRKLSKGEFIVTTGLYRYSKLQRV